MLFKWTPNFVPNKIIIFGCGGTGSRVAPLVAQFVKSCPWVLSPELTLVDFDVVEEKNLARQNFIASDVGKNKAVVLANRYSKAFGINITPIVHKVSLSNSTENEREAYLTLSTTVKSQNRVNNMFIICVDTPGARRDIIETLEHLCSDASSNVVIDAGNENDFGQVTVHGICGADLGSGDREQLFALEKNIPVDCDIPYIPMDSSYYDRMVTTTTESCAALDQSMAINCLMAINIFSIVQNIFYVKPINFFRVNISLQHGAIPEYISVDYFKRLAKNRTEALGKDNVLHRLVHKSFSREIDRLLNDVHNFRESMKPKEVEKPKKKASKTEVIAEVPLARIYTDDIVMTVNLSEAIAAPERVVIQRAIVDVANAAT